MTNLLRVLDLLQKADIKALECEIPTELLKGLNLQEDGTVDLETLLKICHRANRVDAFKTQQVEKDPDLMDFIFNPDRASEFSNPTDLARDQKN